MSESAVYEGKANIFEELALPDATQHLLKAQIVAELYRLHKQGGLTQALVGERLGISQPEVSRMFKGHFREYSVERLLGFLTMFNRNVEILVRPGPQSGEHGQVTFTSTL